ncbi:MAG: flagellar basal body P-ring formation protein FlgA [Pseudorhodoplanes sp.]|nr:flagellar basal body P-ring formation protein FlgA [Pseudorhodoplanes sp.]
MRRLILTAALLALPAAATAQSTGSVAPQAPALRAQVVVASDLVRIGDLVDHPGAAADIAVFRAPDLGETGSVPAERVAEALRRHGVIALDMKGLSEVSVTRAGRAITQAEIEARIVAALSAQHLAGDATSIAITFDRPVDTLHVEPNAASDLAVTRLTYDPRSRRFDAALDLPGSQVTKRHPLRFTGTALETTSVIVLARPVARGEVLSAADVTIQRRPKSEAVADSMREGETVIGLSVRHALRAGTILRRTELMKPELVARNESVMLIYEIPGMTLTMRGTAQEAGAEGDIVNILNTQSKRVVQGVVTGPGRVVVTPSPARAAGQVKRSVAALNTPNRPQ